MYSWRVASSYKLYTFSIHDRVLLDSRLYPLHSRRRRGLFTLALGSRVSLGPRARTREKRHGSHTHSQTDSTRRTHRPTLRFYILLSALATTARCSTKLCAWGYRKASGPLTCTSVAHTRNPQGPRGRTGVSVQHTAVRVVAPLATSPSHVGSPRVVHEYF